MLCLQNVMFTFANIRRNNCKSKVMSKNYIYLTLLLQFCNYSFAIQILFANNFLYTLYRLEPILIAKENIAIIRLGRNDNTHKRIVLFLDNFSFYPFFQMRNIW